MPLWHLTFFCITLYIHLCSAISLQLSASTLAPGQTTNLQWTRSFNDPTEFTLVVYKGGAPTSDGGTSLNTLGKTSGTVSFTADQDFNDGSYVLFAVGGNPRRSQGQVPFTVQSPASAPPPTPSSTIAQTPLPTPTQTPISSSPTPTQSPAVTSSTQGTEAATSNTSQSSSLAVVSNKGASNNRVSTDISGSVVTITNPTTITEVEDGTTILVVSASSFTTTLETPATSALPSSQDTSGAAATSHHSAPKPGVVIGAIVGSLLGVALIAVASRVIHQRRRRTKREQYRMFKGSLMVSGSPQMGSVDTGSGYTHTIPMMMATSPTPYSPYTDNAQPPGANAIPYAYQDHDASANPYGGMDDEQAGPKHPYAA